MVNEHSQQGQHRRLCAILIKVTSYEFLVAFYRREKGFADVLVFRSVSKIISSDYVHLVIRSLIRVTSFCSFLSDCPDLTLLFHSFRILRLSTLSMQTAADTTTWLSEENDPLATHSLCMDRWLENKMSLMISINTSSEKTSKITDILKLKPVTFSLRYAFVGPIDSPYAGRKYLRYLNNGYRLHLNWVGALQLNNIMYWFDWSCGFFKRTKPTKLAVKNDFS